MSAGREHGGGLDAARARYGGTRAQWIDLSTGINPTPYPIAALPAQAWTALPDRDAQARLEQAARDFWQVPPSFDIVAAPGASALIALMPGISAGERVRQVSIPGPTYNEHEAAFRAQSWQMDSQADLRVLVHPNNPDGRLWQPSDLTARQHIIDESFCDIAPDQSLLPHMGERDIVLKSFGKFWGLAGLRLGFAIGAPQVLAGLRALIGPWAVSGPALAIGAAALEDRAWAARTRAQLAQSAARLDALMPAPLVGGTTLFRLYDVGDGPAWQHRLAEQHIWSRTFSYNARWLRLGLPPQERWAQLEAAL